MNSPTGNGPFRLREHPAHLGRGATTIPQPAFTGDMSWYAGYGERHGSEGVEGRLLSMHTFEESWSGWEVHPFGSEVVIVTAGRMKLIQERSGKVTELVLGAGEYAINPPGVWHTADVVDGPASAVFITSGMGTEHRSR